MKITMTATELSETEVERVALVKRGANRTPFRITKSEGEEMIDLHSTVRKVFAKKEAAPSILAIGFQKSDASDALRDMLINAKVFDAAPEVSVNDGTVSVAKKDADTSDAAVIKMSGETLMLVPGGEAIKKEFSSYNFDSTIFGEVMKQGSFYPSIMVAQDLLGNTIMNIMDEASNPKEAADAITKACKEFTDYTATLTKSLPAKAFKADALIHKAAKQTMTVQEAAAASDQNNETQTGDGFGSASLTNNGQSASNMIPPGYELGMDQSTGAPFLFKKAEKDFSDEEKAAIAKAEREGKKPTKKGEEALPDFKGFMAEMREAIAKGGEGITKAFDAKVAELRKDIGKVNEKVEKTDKALAGTLVGGDGGEHTGISKDEEQEDRPIPVIDTAFTKVDRAERPSPRARH